MEGNPYEDGLHPPVDGKSEKYKKMFFFTYNKCSPNVVLLIIHVIKDVFA